MPFSDIQIAILPVEAHKSLRLKPGYHDWLVYSDLRCLADHLHGNRLGSIKLKEMKIVSSSAVKHDDLNLAATCSSLRSVRSYRRTPTCLPAKPLSRIRPVNLYTPDSLEDIIISHRNMQIQDCLIFPIMVT